MVNFFEFSFFVLFSKTYLSLSTLNILAPLTRLRCIWQKDSDSCGVDIKSTPCDGNKKEL